MKNEEIWKDIAGFEGLYQISDKGRVKSLWFGKERILKHRITHKGYLQVILYKNNEPKTCKVHRLVAKSFIPNPQNLPEVNHKDENKTNNCVQNLEFCDRKYNINYGTRNQKSAEKRSKPVLQFTKTGEFVKEWKSTMDVKRNLGYSCGHISSCCLGKQKTSYGFIWKYK